MPEPIGNFYPTQIPTLSDNANIQEALRLYHYGEFSEPTFPDSDSISGYLNFLQTQISENQSDSEIKRIMGAY
jgi:hypothetical protein